MIKEITISTAEYYGVQGAQNDLGVPLRSRNRFLLYLLIINININESK